MHTDKDLTPADIQTLASRDGVAAFFAALGYRTDPRLPQTPATLGVTAESLQKQIKYAERVAFQENGAETLDIYLIELSSVTVAVTQGIARALRNRSGNYLLVLTDDYERMDFVLIERSLPASPSSAMVTRQVLVRPRILTVNRRNPTIVHLRVLRRFTCTETDSDAQYDKLLSAYGVADWSEPFFNNRALFSDYYLNERLPERPEWKERPENAYRQLVQLLANPRERLAGQGNTRQHLLEPAFQALGFSAERSKAKDDYLGPDYRLYAPDSPEKPLALCLAYTWNRYLDGRDETRDTDKPDENPGARVVALLDAGEAPWAILTNGKIWRLYSAKAHSRATNYYEIDLEETLATADPNEAFRYFWLLFRASAFAPRDVMSDGQKRTSSFLDELLEASESYARDIGERLKERVFEQIFPHFVEGFIEHLRSQPPLTGFQQGALLPVAQQLALKREPDEGFRREVFQGTLTFLYRLLFLLYAESRNLLPVKEVRGYWENSLTRMKQEVADKAGTIEDQVADKLGKAYSSDYTATALYDRLLKLFAIIDKGSRETNVPLYNGGLFLTSPDAGDSTPESENARFLLSHRIPDRHLALGLDRLARDIDQKRQDLVFIDYKSLGVRQLGSMYEGLLEFRVRVAPEKMAVVQGKRTEEIISYREALKTGHKVLTRGRGKNAEERVYHPGEVYLENDRRERKASGSYYTPDHIVKYIVEHAVGPVLEERFNSLRSGFREAQQAYRTKLRNAKALEKQGMKPDDPAKVAISFRHLVDELFDVKVLDPAMGSGHFLVEAVDFICDRILGQREGFLQAFLWNPVTEFLQNTRQAILSEIERQGISIDATRLTDINLLKRHVLKRCVYGVDLNPMAVELAKVSLWLDCFTLGAPLSFLDHHLKRGNSLIGTSVQSVEDELATQKKGHIADLFGGPFSGLLSSTATMLELARTPDVTVAEAERSRSLFAAFEKDQAPYKNALDIWLSRHFGNPRAQEYLTLVGHDFVSEIRSGGEGLSTEYRLVIGKAESLSKEKHFFHWDLEFPEAFIDLGHGTWKHKEKQGFDAVVGNPPYDELSEDALGRPLDELSYLQWAPTFQNTGGGRLNWYHFFVLQAVQVLRGQGFHSFIVPMSFMGDRFTYRLRKWIIENQQLVGIEAFPQKDDPTRRVFREAKLPTCVYVLQRSAPALAFTVRTHPGKEISLDSRSYTTAHPDIIEFDPFNLTIPTVSTSEWRLVQRWAKSRAIEAWGTRAGAVPGELMANASLRPYLTDSSKGPEIIRGAHIGRYELYETPKQGEALYLNEASYLMHHTGSEKAKDHEHDRMVYQRYAAIDNYRRLIATILPAGHWCSHTTGYVDHSEYDPRFLLAVFNGRLLEWRFSLTSSNNNINSYEVAGLPLPRIKFTTAKAEREEVLARIKRICEGTLDGPALSEIDQICKMCLVPPETTPAQDEKPDVIHDILVFLAQQMIDLNKEKHEHQNSFWKLAERFLQIAPDGDGISGLEAFSGKTVIRNFLGDYQKGERAVPFDDLLKIVVRNRARIGVPLTDDLIGRLKEEYESALSVLVPLTETLARIDTLIDRIVYRLYDLTEQEIATIEGQSVRC